jgi:hypothetical protein
VEAVTDESERDLRERERSVSERDVRFLSERESCLER